MGAMRFCAVQHSTPSMFKVVLLGGGITTNRLNLRIKSCVGNILDIKKHLTALNLTLWLTIWDTKDERILKHQTLGLFNALNDLQQTSK